MAAKKYLKVGTTGIEEQAATTSSAGAANEGDLVALDAAGKLALNMMPAGVGPATKSIVASEAMTAPCLVNVWNDAGTTKVRYADASAASAAKRAHGFILVSATLGNPVAVYFEGEVTGLTGLTGGTTMFLSNSVPGGTQNTAVITAGHILQEIGVATSTTSLDFEPAKPILRS